jgi:hypothetical protein
MLFEPDKSFVGCRICGAVYQSTLDRYPSTPADILQATANRRRWADRHATLHTSTEHAQLRKSGLLMTPEAAQNLSGFGVVPVSDMVLSEETEDALAKANAISKDDSEG